MPQPIGFHVRLGWSGWLRLLLGLGLVLAVAAVAALFLLGIFIVLLPIAVLSALLLYFFPNLRNPRPRRPSDPDIIDGDYRVVDPRQLDRDREPGDRL